MTRLACSLAAAFLAGCAAVEMPGLPGSDVPVAWDSAPAGGVPPEEGWWTQFAADELSAIIAGVKTANLDLGTVARNLEAAQLTLREAGLELMPMPALTAQASVGTDSRSDSTNTSASLGGTLAYAGILSKPARYDAALARYDADAALAADAALNILGTAASAYFRVLINRDLIVAAQQNLENAQQIARIVQARVDAGTITPIDALQQSIAVERQRNAVKDLVQEEFAARASLALLLGRSVQGFDISAQTLDGIQVPRVQPGLPAELLARRPDIVQAEANLRAAHANVRLARAAFLPDITLTASGNVASDSLGSLLEAPDAFLATAANLAQTLVDDGRRSRNVRRAQLSMESSLAAYRKSVLSAFNDIDVRLKSIALLNSQEAVALEDRRRAEESFRIAELRYSEGVADYQTVLLSQNALFSARNAYLNNKLARLNATVALYQALGGGWESSPDRLSAPQPQPSASPVARPRSSTMEQSCRVADAPRTRLFHGSSSPILTARG